MHPRECTCAHVHVFACSCVYPWECMFARVRLCVCTCVSVCVHVCMLRPCDHLCLCTCLCMCPCSRAHMCKSVCVRAFVCVCASVCACIHMCTWQVITQGSTLPTPRLQLGPVTSPWRVSAAFWQLSHSRCFWFVS